MKKEDLRDWRRSTQFYCPQCNVPVQLKVGDIVIPHFAHKKDEACSASFSEGESKAHLLGKQQLYAFFQKHAEDVTLEPYFKQLSQRPDLLVTTGSDYVPIEFQCSTIPISLIESRTSGYRNAGMKPIWILQTPAKFSTIPEGVGIFHFSRFHESFFTHQSPEGVVFLTYNPQTEKFHYFSSLIHIAGKRYIGIHRTLPISTQVFPFAKPKVPSHEELIQYAKHYLSTRNHLLQSRVLLNRKGINDPFLRNCYELRIRPINLPLWIGVPVPFSNAFEEHDCEWQLDLVYFMRQNGVGFRSLSIELIENFVSRQKEASKEQINACIAYRNIFSSSPIEIHNRKGILMKTN